MDESKEHVLEHHDPIGLNIDYTRLLFRSIRYWYIFVLSVMIAVVIAYLRNRYAVRIYPVTASVIVKEVEDLSGGDLIYNNPLVNFRRNYLNEIYILKSYPLLQRVIEDLDFDVAFYREGSIITTETYDNLPIETRADRTRSLKSNSFRFTILSSAQFQMQGVEPDKTPAMTFNFGDTIRYEDFTGIFKVTDKEALKSLLQKEFLFSYTPPSILASTYAERLEAGWAEEGAGVISLSINGSNPKKAKDFLTGVISQYQEYDLENKNETASRTVNFISQQLAGISDSLRIVELQLEQFKSKNVVTDLSGEALRLYQKIEGLETQRSQLKVSEDYYNYLIKYIQQEKKDHVILPTSIGINDPILTSLVIKLSELQRELTLIPSGENPVVRGTEKQIAALKKEIIESVRNQRSTDQIRLSFLDREIKSVERQLNYLPVTERNLVAIQRNYGLLENLYLFLIQRRSEAAISQAANTSDIVVVNPPKVGSAISPKVTRNYIIAVSFGFLIPLVVFVLLELFDNRIQSKDDIEKLTSIPFIGGVGHKRTDTNLAVFNQPKSALAESFRALRSNLSYFIGQKQNAVFLITSSISGEGKTFSSINLAAVLSMSGKKALIVGADMRRPKIFSDFGLSNDIGLSTFLAGLSAFRNVVQKTTFDNLDFISGGPIPPNPSELLLSEKMKMFIEEAKANYDFVVIDTPPLAVVTDAFVISSYADHVIFLVRQNYTPKALLRTAQEFFADGKLKNISIVLNDIHKSGPGYGYGYNYGYGYSYGYQYGGKETNAYYEE